MKTTITECEFIQEFLDVRPDNFSYYGLIKLYKYFINFEEVTDFEMELDVIAICDCYTEYSSMEKLTDTYPQFEDIEDIAELENKLMEYTSVVCCNDDENCIIIQDF